MLSVHLTALALTLVVSAQEPDVDQVHRDLVRQLVRASWPMDVAESVATCQAPILAQAALGDPEQAKARVERLKGLGRHAPAMRLLYDAPDLTEVVLAHPDPSTAAGILYELGDRADVRNTFLMFPGETREVVDLLVEYREALIGRPLDDEGFDSLPVQLLLTPTVEEEPYRQLVADLLMWSSASTERRNAVIGSLSRTSDEVRRMMRSSPEPVLAAARTWMRYCDDHPDRVEWICGIQLEIDQLLRFFQSPNSRLMAERIGLDAPFMILDMGTSESIRADLSRILPDTDPAMRADMATLNGQYGFPQLLARTTLPLATMKAAIRAAAAETQKLRRWLNFSDDAIARDVGTLDMGYWGYVPFVDISAKLIDGREITAWDGVMVAVDAASIFVPLAKGAGGLRHAGKILKSDIKKIASKYGKEAGERAMKLATDPVQLQKELPDVFEAAVKASVKRELKEGGLDVTKVVHWVYEKMGAKGKYLRRISALEPRIFMRSDRKVIFVPHKTLLGRVLKETIDNKGIEVAIENGLPGASAIAPHLRASADAAMKQINAIWLAVNEPKGFGALMLRQG
jgi:hypothetical protein